jgi:hypothetical protein
MRLRPVVIAVLSSLVAVPVAAKPRVATGTPSKVGPANPGRKKAPPPPPVEEVRELDAFERAEAAVEKARAELPEPPSAEPAVYKPWLRGLTKAERARVMRFCRSRPVDYEPVCGGIGPLHIPSPPSLVVEKAVPGQPQASFDDSLKSHDQWRAALTAQQRRYVDFHCRKEEQMYSTLCGATPLVVAFDSQPVEFSAGGSFAFLPGDPMASDWPTAKTPWLARDLDGDGSITSGAELFGSNTALPDGTAAKNGFVALAPLDDNRDGRVDAQDAAFASLLLWSDRNGDRQSTPDELAPLASKVVSITLENAIEIRCDARTNCERERSAMEWRDERGVHRGSVVDVYLPRRRAN